MTAAGWIITTSALVAGASAGSLLLMYLDLVVWPSGRSRRRRGNRP